MSFPNSIPWNKQRFLCVGDPHFWDKNITSRLDNSSETSLEKAAEIVKIATENDATLILNTGDFFHANIRSKKWLYELKSILSSGVPWVTIVGNHDNHEGVSSRQDLFSDVIHLVLDGYLRDVAVNPYMKMTGVSAYFDPVPNEEAELILTHHLIAPFFREKLVLTPETLIQSFPNMKVILAGHDHICYPPEIYEVGGKKVLIVRPGSVMRVNSKASENDRIPEVTLLCMEDLSCKSIPITTKPFNKIFNLDIKEKEAKKEFDIQSFSETVAAAKSLSSKISETFETSLELIIDPLVKEFVRKDLSQRGFLSG